MKKLKSMKMNLFAAALLIVAFSSCKKEELNQTAIGNEITTKDKKEDPCNPKKPNLRVLFIGNSYTANYTVHIPRMFKDLGDFNGQTPTVLTRATLGASLDEHLATASTISAINQGNWDYVILQENAGDLAFTPGFATTFANSVASLKSTILVNSPNAKILLYQMVPPENENTSAYTNLQTSWNTLFTTVATNNSIGVCNIGQAFTNAYAGDFDFVFSPDQLRLGSGSQHHFQNSGGFLAAVAFYTAIYNTKPCIPTDMTFDINGNLNTGAVATYAPQFHSLAQIGYVQSYNGKLVTNKECQFMYAAGHYPCE